MRNAGSGRTALKGCRWLAFFACWLVLPSSAWTALGENVSSVETDASTMRGTVQSMEVGPYRVQEIRAPYGNVVREYVSPSGRVFGVAWQGPFLPDLQELLGSYFEQYMKPSEEESGARGPLVIQAPGFVLQSGGHMRAFLGRAYVPDLLPSGVEPADIK